MTMRRPGPLSGINNSPIDRGTMARVASCAPGVVGRSNENPPKKTTITFAALWKAYPSKKPYIDSETGKPPAGYDNQCAIKVSVALEGAGFSLKNYKGAAVSLGATRAAIRAQEMAKWLAGQKIDGIEAPIDITGKDWESKIKGRTGIVYFADYWARPGEKAPTGDHIDLWNGSRLTASGLEGVAVAIARFGFGINSVPDAWSDLGAATKIMFWEVK
ncbi:MAG: type VI secretion system amidase effector protein Tae4 [Pseudomonas sp.]|uniref:T6SS effector amidase Tae4 family protein n=1 Tax=Pseudomonas sp. TaxID=306 RepID=UPI003391FE61